MLTDVSCRDCGHTKLFFDKDALSRICSRCGALYDPAQIQIEDTTEVDDGSWQLPGADVASRALKRSDGTVIQAWQTNETRRDILRGARHKLIRDLLSALKQPQDSLRRRAVNLFDAMQQRTQSAGGTTRAECIAAACVAIACREAKLPESLGEIALLIGQSPVTVARVSRRIARVFSLHLPPMDPSLWLPVLVSHLRVVASGNNPLVPVAVAKSMLSTSVDHILHWSTTVLSLFSVEGLHVGRHSGAIGCAAVILALETEAGIRLRGVEKLAMVLSDRVGVRGFTTMERYHEMLKILEARKTSLTRLYPDNCIPRRVERRKKKSDRSWMKEVLIAEEAATLLHTDKSSGSMLRSSPENGSKEGISIGHVIRQHDDMDGYSTCSSGGEEDVTKIGNCTREQASCPTEGCFPAGDTNPHAIPVRSAFSRPSRYKERPALKDASDVLAVQSLLTPALSDMEPQDSDQTVRFLLRAEAQVAHVFNIAHRSNRISRLAAERGGADEVRDEELFSDGELEAYINVEGPSVDAGNE